MAYLTKYIMKKTPITESTNKKFGKVTKYYVYEWKFTRKTLTDVTSVAIYRLNHLRIT